MVGILIELHGVPFEALAPLAEQLRKYQAVVTFHENMSGLVQHESGSASFHLLRDLTLVVKILHNPGHFPRRLLLGGIRQLVEETVESLQMDQVTQ